MLGKAIKRRGRQGRGDEPERLPGGITFDESAEIKGRCAEEERDEEAASAEVAAKCAGQFDEDRAGEHDEAEQLQHFAK